jgi:hypothetical protein
MLRRFGVWLCALAFGLASASAAAAQPTQAQIGTWSFPGALFENGQHLFSFEIIDDAPDQVTLLVSSNNATLAPASAFTVATQANFRHVVYRIPFDQSGPLTLRFEITDPAFPGVSDSRQWMGQVRPVEATPIMPSNFVAAIAGDQTTFSWAPPPPKTGASPSDLPSHYLLEIGEAPGLTSIPAIRIPFPVFTHSIRLPRGGYTFRLRAGNRLGLGPVTAEDSIGLANGPNIPGPPAGLAISLSPSGLATATWAPPGFGATPLSYIIEVGTAAGLSNIGRFPLPGSVRSASGGLGPGTYAVRIRGVSAAGEGPASAEVFLTIPGPCSPPAAPTLGTLLRNGPMVMVPWTAPPAGQAEMYELAAGSTPGAADLAVLPVSPATSYFQVAPGAGTYHVFVRALSSCGSSGPSNVVSYVEPPPAVPGAPRALTGTTGPGSAALNWNPPVTGSKVDDYILEAGFGPGAAVFVVPLPGNLPGVAFSGVPRGTYFVRIKARNEQGTSPASNEITLTVP